MFTTPGFMIQINWRISISQSYAEFKTTHGNKAEINKVPKFRYNDRDKNIGTNFSIQNFV